MKCKFIALILFFAGIINAQDTLLIKSVFMPSTDTVLIFTPSNYDSGAKYPLLFMLHGWSGNYNQWNEIIDLSSTADEYKFIIVCPDGFYDSWYVNSPVIRNSQFESFFFDELVCQLFKKYRVDVSNIFITGLSMGGHGAVYLMLKNPDFFKSAGSTSGILDLTAFPNKWGLNRILGDISSSPQTWSDYSAIFLLSRIEWLKKPIIIDCGTEDFAYNVNERFADMCKIYGVDVKFNSSKGNHNREYWKRLINNHLKFFQALVEE